MKLEDRATVDHPYTAFEGTPQWSLLNKALDDLKNNRDLEEKTSREYILGHLCEVLVSGDAALSARKEDRDPAFVDEVVAKAQQTMRRANPERRSLVDELLAERRAESARA